MAASLDPDAERLSILDLELVGSDGGRNATTALLGIASSDGVGRVLMQDENGAVIDSIRLPEDLEPCALASSAAIEGTDGEIAVVGIGRSSRAAQVWVYRLGSHLPHRSIDFESIESPRDASFFDDGSGESRLALLGLKPDSPEVRVAVEPAPSEQGSRRLTFGAGFEPLQLAFLEAPDGEEERGLHVAVLGAHASPFQLRIQIRRLADGAFVRSVPLAGQIEPEPLPDWLDRNRVHGHTRLRPSKWSAREGSIFSKAAAGFRELGAGVFTRHVIWGDEDPWWPSRAPRADDGSSVLARQRSNDGIQLSPGQDLIQEIVTDAHRQGLRLIAYYWHQSDARFAAGHPEWVLRDFDGRPIRHPARGTFLDISGPYREIVLTRLLELAAMGVDGFYFDSAQMPRDSGFNAALSKEFSNATGLAAPTSSTAGGFPSWLDFKAAKIEQTLRYWRDRVNVQFPHVVFVISAERVSSMTDRSVSTRQAALGIPKSEFRKAADTNRKFLNRNPDLVPPASDIQDALGWTILRDAAHGRPPHIWSPGFPDESHALAFVTAVTAHGAIANMDVHEDAILSPLDAPQATPRAALRAAFDLGSRISPHLAGTEPVRFAAVHFSEHARDVRGFEERRAWQEVLAPVLEVFGYFLRTRQPVGIVNDDQLSRGDLAGYEVLFLPSAADLTPAQRSSVARFDAAGGVVVANRAEWRWSDGDGRVLALAALRRKLQRARLQSPLTVVGGPERLHAVAYRSRALTGRPAGTRGPHQSRLVVAITNDFTWVQGVKRRRPDPARVIHRPAPPVAAGVEIRWRDSALGLGPASRAHAFEALTGEPLRIRRRSGESRVLLPEFQQMALVVVE